MRHDGAQRISPPDPRRPPLRANIFEMARDANVELQPLFPYLGPGAIVPAGALFVGAPGEGFGRFFHRNSQEEVVVCWGARDDFFTAGMLAVNGKMHEVTAPLADATDPETFMIGTITQRQADAGVQTESVIFRCDGCNEKLHQCTFDANPPTDGGADRFPAFASLPETLRGAEEYNERVAGQPCPKCGAIAPRFPVERWGWDEWTRRHVIVNEGFRSLQRAAHELLGTSASA